MKATFKIMFFAQRTKPKANGNVPILARITVNGQMSTFSPQLDIAPDRWDSHHQRTLGITKKEKEINAYIDQIQSSISRHYYDLQSEGKIITPEKLKQKLCCTEDAVPHSYIELCEMFMKDYEALSSTEHYANDTLYRHRRTVARLKVFIQQEYGVKDLPLDSINKAFLDKLYVWLRTDQNQCNNTTIKFMHRCSSMWRMGMEYGWVSHNPFRLQRHKPTSLIGVI